MIFGIGNDIVDMRRFTQVAARFPQRFPRYILTTQEQQQFMDKKMPLSFLAGRWAAKEALGKAIGCGVRTPLGFAQVGVCADEHGKPQFVFAASAADFLKQHGVGDCHLSISHDGHYACAMVIAEKKQK